MYVRSQLIGSVREYIPWVKTTNDNNDSFKK